MDGKLNPTTNYNFMEDKTKQPKKKRKKYMIAGNLIQIQSMKLDKGLGQTR